MAARTHAGRDLSHRAGLSRLGPAPTLWWAGAAAVNFAAFVLVAAGWSLLATEDPMDLRLAVFLRPLHEVLFHPLSIFTHPWLIVVIGLLLGVVAGTPVIVVTLQRVLPAGLLLGALHVLAVAAVAQAPVLAVVVALGCALAALGRFWYDMHFSAVLLGLLPVGGYMLFSVVVAADSASVLPIQRWVLPAPFGIALAAALLAAAAALLLARVRRARLLAPLPAMAAAAAAALVLFDVHIGADELAYARIADGLSGDDKLFQDLSLAEWKRRHGAEGLNPQTLANRVEELLTLRRIELSERCARFRRDCPRSDRMPEVLWIQGQCASLQLKRRALPDGLVSYDASYPSPASADVWSQLLHHHPGTPQAALAAWHLAVLDLREQRVAQARDALGEAASRLQAFLQAQPAAALAGSTGELFLPPPTLPAREYCADALFKVRWLIWIIDQNALLDDPRAAEAFAEYLRLNPNAFARGDEHFERLCELAGRYEDTRFGDNLRLAVARAESDPYEEARALVQLARETTDAAIEAHFQLGRLTMQLPVLGLLEGVREPQQYFEIVVAAPPNPWQDLARQRLKLLAAGPAETP